MLTLKKVWIKETLFSALKSYSKNCLINWLRVHKLHCMYCFETMNRLFNRRFSREIKQKLLDIWWGGQEWSLINKHSLSFFWHLSLIYVIKHLHVCNVHECNYENKLPVSKPSFLKIKFFCSSRRNTMRSWEKFERGMRSRSKKWKRFDTYQINVCSSLKSINFYFAEKLWAECVYLLSSLFRENSFIWFVQCCSCRF